MKTNPQCKYCSDNEDDTIEHYFFQCTDVLIFWNSFCRWWKDIHDFSFALKEQDIIFGVENENCVKCIDVLNFCILLGKYYIYNTKRNQGKISILEYKHVMKNKIEILKVLYDTSGKSQYFHEHWARLYNNI